MYKEISCIYKITSPSGKVYIGQTINLKNRTRKYKGMFFKGQLKLWNNCQKYNWNPLDTLEVIEECLVDDLNKQEIYWINYYDSFNNGLNCDLGGVGRLGYSHSEETKEKLRTSNLGKKHTEESKTKISIAMQNIPKEVRSTWKTNKGTKLSKDHTDKIKQSKKENPFKMSKQQRENISKNNIGNTNMLGKTHTDETKLKISESKKGKILTCYDKKILNVTTGVVYQSQREAAEKLETRIANILRVCNGDRKTCKGMVLKYYEEEDCSSIGSGH